jgi:hypothetical protein
MIPVSLVPYLSGTFGRAYLSIIVLKAVILACTAAFVAGRTF